MSTTFPPSAGGTGGSGSGAALPVGSILRVQGNLPAPPGYAFLDSSITNATEQGCSVTDATVQGDTVLDAGLVVTAAFGTNTALEGNRLGFFSAGLVDPVHGDISYLRPAFDLTATYSEASLVSALFIPGTPSRLYLVLRGVLIADESVHCILLTLVPNLEKFVFDVESQEVLDATALSLDFIYAWGSSLQCSLVVPSTAAEGASVCALRLGGSTSAWLLWDLGAVPGVRVTVGDGFATADSIRMNTWSVARVFAHSAAGDAVVVGSLFDNVLRVRTGVYYDATHDVMAATASAFAVAVPQQNTAVRPMSPRAGEVARFVAYTPLGFVELAADDTLDTGGAIVEQTSARHPQDTGVGRVMTGLVVTDGTCQVSFSDGMHLTCDYNALRAGFERKAVKVA